MKAVVLAAGEGTRLRPLTRFRPKPMLPVANRPLLEHVVKAVASAGIDDLVLVVGYHRKRIQNHFGDGTDWGIDITYAHQAKQLGTGHAVLQAEPHIDDSFIVLNGDRIIDAEIVERLAAPDTTAPTMAIRRSTDPSRYGVVELDGDSVTRIVEKPPEHATRSELINAGVYRFSPAVFDTIRDTETTGELMLTATLNRIATNGGVRAVRYDGKWLDVTYLWDLLSVNANSLDRHAQGVDDAASVHESAVVSRTVDIGRDVRIHPNATVLAGTSLGDNVEVGSNVVLANTVVLPDTAIGDGTVLRDCVVGANTVIGPNVTVAGGTADVIAGDELHKSVRLGAVVGDNSDLRGGVSLAPGTVVGNDTTVHEGAVVDGRLEDNATVRRG